MREETELWVCRGHKRSRTVPQSFHTTAPKVTHALYSARRAQHPRTSGGLTPVESGSTSAGPGQGATLSDMATRHHTRQRQLFRPRAILTYAGSAGTPRGPGQDSLDARLDVRDRGGRPGWADAQKRAAGVGLESQRGLPTHSCVIYGVGQVQHCAENRCPDARHSGSPFGDDALRSFECI